MRPVFSGTHVAPGNAKLDRRTEDGQSDPFKVLCFAAATKTVQYRWDACMFWLEKSVEIMFQLEQLGSNIWRIYAPIQMLKYMVFCTLPKACEYTVLQCT